MSNWYLRLPNNLRAGINTAWQAALGYFLLNVLGFMADVQQWAGDTSQDFPSVSPLGKAVAGTLVGLVVGVLTAIYRAIKPGPVYEGTETKVVPAADSAIPDPNRDVGQAGVTVILLLLALACFIVFALIAHGTIKSDEGFTWLGAGLVWWVLAILVPSFDRRQP